MQVTRLIDANGNRAREALRCMEDAARFLLDDAPLAAEAKAMRHELTATLSGIPNLTQQRDTPGDVGRELTTPGEAVRGSVAAVVEAAGGRLGEALRVIEEYAKMLPPPQHELAAAAERLRYRGYTLQQRLTQRLGSGRMGALPGGQWRLCLLLTQAMCEPLGWRAVLQGAIRGGADCVQLREKTMGDAALLARAREVVAIAHAADPPVSVIVNDRVDLALLAGADGVHLGQTDVSIGDARKLCGRQLLIGVSTSRIEEAEAAKAAGADYCGVGPMYASTTKKKNRIAGPNYLREYIERVKLPHLTIGGITTSNVGELADVGARGVAVSAALCRSEEPERIAAKIIAALN